MPATKDRYVNGVAERRIDQLRIGDRVDLQNDCIADPECDETRFAFEFETVSAIEVESPECTRVDFESGFSCGFPPEHWVEVDSEQER